MASLISFAFLGPIAGAGLACLNYNTHCCATQCDLPKHEPFPYLQFGGALNYEEGLHMLKKRGFNPTQILDIGANMGLWTRGAKHIWPEAHTFMLEADPKLRTPLAAVGEPFAIALLGNATSNVSMFMSTGSKVLRTTGNSLFQEHSVYYRKKGFFERQDRVMQRLDDVLAEHAPGVRFTMAKFDVQGAELLVLQGARQTLAHVDVILMEVAVLNVNEGAPSAHEVFAELGSLGFQMYNIVQISYHPGMGKSRGVGYMDVVFVRRGSPLWSHEATGVPPPKRWGRKREALSP